MGLYKYITNRTYASKAGEENAGRLRAAVKNDSDTAEGEYTCPECKKGGKVNQEFKRPFSVKCEHCGFVIKVPKLKGKK